MQALLAALPAALLAAASSFAAPPATEFWNRYELLRERIAQQPDSAWIEAEVMLRGEPRDFLGHWLLGAAMALGDSAGALEHAVRAAAERDLPGRQIEAGTILIHARRFAEGRAAFDRARDLYLAAGDTLDAARAAFWKVVRSADRGDRTDPEPDIAETEALARRSGDPATLAAVLIYRGERGMRRDLKAAVPNFTEALALLSPLPPGRQLLACRRGLGSALRATGDYTGSESHYRGAMEIAHTLGDSAQEVRALMGIGSIRKAQGAYDEARAIQARALAMALATGDRRLAAIAYYDLGTLQWETARHREAETNLLASLRAMEEARWETDNKVNLLDALGGVATALGNYDSARRYLEQARELALARNLKATGTFVYLHLGDLHRELGDYEAARAAVDEGLALARAASQRRIESVLLSLRAKILNETGDHAGALVAARAGERIALEVEPRNLWRLRLYTANALGNLGRPREGIAALESLLALGQGTADSSQIGYVLQVEGDLVLRAGDPRRAVSILSRSLAISRGIENPRRIADVQLSLGPALIAAGRPGEAAVAIEQGLRWFEDAQAAVRSSEERSGYQSHWYDSYLALARAYRASGRPASAFATLERSRARELRRLIGLGPGALRRKVPAGLAREVEAAEGELTALQALLLHEYDQPAERRPANLTRLERRADSLKTRWGELNRRVEREAPAYAREAGLLPAISAAEVRRRLRPGERLIAFMVGPEATLVFDFRPGQLQVFERAIGEDSLARRIERITAGLRAGGTGGGGPDADALADELLGPCGLAEHPPRMLYIVPDAALHYLPFEALRVADAAGKPRCYLVEWTAVAYANSATLLFHPPASARPAGARPVLVAFGDPALSEPALALGPARASRGALPALGALPHARREVQALPALYPGARIYVGAEATESRFQAEAERASILHVAAHAFVDDRHPEFSGVVLAPDLPVSGKSAPDDGLVQAFEVVERSYDLDLATLSACESGSGTLLRGEGLIGLSRAFRLAGARNLLVSLWKVDDAATADFMAEFYARLSHGESPPAALRGAKLAFLSGGAPPRGEKLERGAPQDATMDRGAAASDSSAARGVGRHPRAASLDAPAAWAPFVLLASREP